MTDITGTRNLELRLVEVKSLFSLEFIGLLTVCVEPLETWAVIFNCYRLKISFKGRFLVQGRMKV